MKAHELKIKQSFTAYEPGEYELEIVDVKSIDNSIYIYFDKQLYDYFNFAYKVRVDRCAEVCSQILGISVQRFGKVFDGKDTKAVAKKLKEALVGKTAKVKIISSCCFYTLNNNKAETLVSHKLVIL
jgi:hypothetical protein